MIHAADVYHPPALWPISPREMWLNRKYGLPSSVVARFTSGCVVPQVSAWHLASAFYSTLPFWNEGEQGHDDTG